MKTLSIRLVAAAKTTLVIVFATAFVLAIVPGAQAGECSNRTIAGSWGYTITGSTFNTGPVLSGPMAVVGRQTYDLRGNITGTQTANLNGNVFRQVLTGTYTVNPDCTGTMTVFVSPPGITGHVDFVVVNGGTEMRVIGTDGGGTSTGNFKKLVPNE
jgi:hypothetical protein